MHKQQSWMYCLHRIFSMFPCSNTKENKQYHDHLGGKYDLLCQRENWAIYMCYKGKGGCSWIARVDPKIWSFLIRPKSYMFHMKKTFDNTIMTKVYSFCTYFPLKFLKLWSVSQDYVLEVVLWPVTVICFTVPIHHIVLKNYDMNFNTNCYISSKSQK